MRGLALARDARATERLRGIAAGEVRPSPGGRDLRVGAGETMEALDQLQGRSAVNRAVGGRTGGEPEVVSDGDVSADRGVEEAVRSQVDAVFDSAHTTVKHAALTFANHPNVSNPMTNSQLDAVLKAATLHLGRADFSSDVACCAGMQRLGDARTFGTATDGLDVIDNEAEFYAVVNHTVGRVKVVRLINYCGGPGSNILGCSWVGGNGMVLVRFGDVPTEAALWAHEYGHNAGLAHNPQPNYIMHSCLCGGTLGLTQVECGYYWTPAAGTQIAMATIGACTDGDTDQVQDLIDNCPANGNNDQRDSDGDGIGDVCEGLPVLTPTPSRNADADADAAGHVHADAHADENRHREYHSDSVAHRDAVGDAHGITYAHARRRRHRPRRRRRAPRRRRGPRPPP